MSARVRARMPGSCLGGNYPRKPEPGMRRSAENPPQKFCPSEAKPLVEVCKSTRIISPPWGKGQHLGRAAPPSSQAPPRRVSVSARLCSAPVPTNCLSRRLLPGPIPGLAVSSRAQKAEVGSCGVPRLPAAVPGTPTRGGSSPAMEETEAG